MQRIFKEGNAESQTAPFFSYLRGGAAGCAFVRGKREGLCRDRPLSLAKLYGLSVLARNINPKDNCTRFAVLSKTDHKRTGKDKSSIVFSIEKDVPGGLQGILFEFACRAINLTKIESRRAKKRSATIISSSTWKVTAKTRRSRKRSPK